MSTWYSKAQADTLLAGKDAAGAATAAQAAAIAAAATDATTKANAAQAAAVQRANHTGTQAAGTITGLATVATSGAYTDLSAKPTLGTAAAQPTSAFDAAGAATAAAALRAPLLAPTATKTTAYTAAVGDLALMNVAGGATVLTLPTAPADKAQVGYRAIGATTAVPLVVNRGGSDTIGTAGATSASLPMADEVVVLQYDAPNTRWLGVSAVKTQASLDARYDAAGAATASIPDTLNLRRLNDLAAADRQRSTAAARVAYEDSAVFTEAWANLTAWAGGTGLQVSAGALYSNSGSGTTAGTTRAWALGTTGTGRAVLVVNHASGAGSGGLVVGVSSDTAGSAPASGAANAKGLYFHPAAAIQSMDSGTATNLPVGTNPATGTYIVTITADARYLSVVAVKSDGSAEYRTRYARGSYNIQCLYIFNSDSRNLTGDSVGALGARTSIGTITPRTGIEGTARTVQWTTLPSGVSCRVALPPTYDSRKPAPLAVCFHGNGSDETHFADNANGLAVANALTAAGFIVASTGAGSTWGAQAGLDSYYALYQYVRDTYAIGATVFYANSMGGIEAALSLAERRIPSVAAYAATSPTANLASVYVDGSASAVSEALAIGQGEFTTIINTAYGITGTAPNDYATATAGHDPLLKAGSAFRGVPVKLYAATDDYQVFKDQNADKLLTLVAPFSPDATVVSMTGGHSTAQIASNASAIATWLAGYAAA